MQFLSKDSLGFIAVVAQYRDARGEAGVRSRDLDRAGIARRQRLQVGKERPFVHISTLFIEKHGVVGQKELPGRTITRGKGVE
jgi:hypothetical protein